MSINSLCSNPQIVNELILYVESHLPTTGITILNNTDDNVDVSKLGSVGNVNLSQDVVLANGNINITTIDTSLASNFNSIDIYSKDTINYSKLYINNTGIYIYSNSENYNVSYLNNGNFELNGGAKLVLNSDSNIFSTDGTANQVLTTNGNNILSWKDRTATNGYLKNISYFASQLIDSTTTNCNLYLGTINGFTVGKNSLYQMSFSFTPSNVAGTVVIALTVNTNQTTIETYINDFDLGNTVVRAITFNVLNDTVNQEISIDLLNDGGMQFTKSTSDFITFSINEIE